MEGNGTARGGNRTPNWRLIRLRMNAGLSVNDLAARTNVSAPTIRETEKGHVPGPRVQRALAEHFGVKATDIWELPGYSRDREPVG